jgi:hypothetical protein
MKMGTRLTSHSHFFMPAAKADVHRLPGWDAGLARRVFMPDFVS